MEYVEHLYRDTFLTSDLELKCAGKRLHALNHSFGPAVRDHYFLILLHEGEGVFRSAGQTFDLSPHMLFVCYPHEVVSYTATKGSLWNISWISVNGSCMDKLLSHCGIRRQEPVLSPERFSDVSDVFEKIFALTETERVAGSMEALGLVHILLSMLIAEDTGFDRYEDHTDKAIRYIKYNYDRDLHIEELASYVGLERAYFSKVFKAKTSSSPKEYLVAYRMEKALQLLADPTLSIAEVALSVGYGDSLYFSRAFKKQYGFPPSEYRRKQLEVLPEK